MNPIDILNDFINQELGGVECVTITLKSFVSSHDMVVSWHDTIVSWLDTTVSWHDTTI